MRDPRKEQQLDQQHQLCRVAQRRGTDAGRAGSDDPDDRDGHLLERGLDVERGVAHIEQRGIGGIDQLELRRIGASAFDKGRPCCVEVLGQPRVRPDPVASAQS